MYIVRLKMRVAFFTYWEQKAKTKTLRGNDKTGPRPDSI